MNTAQEYFDFIYFDESQMNSSSVENFKNALFKIDSGILYQKTKKTLPGFQRQKTLNVLCLPKKLIDPFFISFDKVEGKKTDWTQLLNLFLLLKQCPEFILVSYERLEHDSEKNTIKEIKWNRKEFFDMCEVVIDNPTKETLFISLIEHIQQPFFGFLSCLEQKKEIMDKEIA